MSDRKVLIDELLIQDEATRDTKPLGRMPLHRWTLVSLWVMRIYVVAMGLLIVLKFLQLTG